MTPKPVQASVATGGDGVVARVRGVVKKFPGVLALDNVDFEIRAGEVRALLGKNGAGKSTLIRILTGASAPDAGEVSILGHRLNQPGLSRTVEAARHGVRAVYQELSQVPEMSVAENLFLGRWRRVHGLLDFREMERRTHAILDRLGLDLDPRAKIAQLSPAQRQLAEIARVFLGEPKLVILDEPTSSLAAAQVELLFKAVRTLADDGIAVIYVSHRMEEIRQIASAATIMRDGRIVDTVDVADASTRDIVRLMLGHDESQDDVIAANPQLGSAPVVLRAAGVALPPKLESVDLELRQGEVLGIAGLLGSGRTELLSVLSGLAAPGRGEVCIDGAPQGNRDYRQRLRHGLGFTPESRKEDGIIPELGVDENIVCTNLDRSQQMGDAVVAAHPSGRRSHHSTNDHHRPQSDGAHRQLVWGQSAKGGHRSVGACRKQHSAVGRADAGRRCRGEAADLRDHPETRRRGEEHHIRFKRDRRTSESLRSRFGSTGRTSGQRIFGSVD